MKRHTRARTHKERPDFGQVVHADKSHARIVPVPQPTPENCVLSLDSVLGKTKASKIVFHMVGDTGGVSGTEMEEAVADAMEEQFKQSPKPSFMYNLGDVVYFNGLSNLYDAQFYEPYKYYPAPIFAIAGNHDGDTKTEAGDTPDNEPSLYGFFENFCSPKSIPIHTYRDSMTQPYVYWTLNAPFATIIGLYGNVDGTIDAPQQQWLTSQLEEADPKTCIIVAVHQPPYSMDASHQGYGAIGDAIDTAAKSSGVSPHAVFSGHVHNYQRFSRQTKQGTIPYIIAGAGGYAHTPRAIHKMQKGDISLPFTTSESSVTLQQYNDKDAGFLRLTIDDTEMTAEYFAVPFDGAVPTAPFDSVVLNHRTRSIS